MRKRDFLAGLGFLALAAPMSSLAIAASKSAVFTGLIDGVAAGGYDVVAYQTGAAGAGKADITAMHEGVTYRFQNEANKAAFEAEPARYAPKYGGYCAYAVSQGYTAKIDPEAWSVVDGALYLNFSKSVRSRWAKDIPGYIASANGNWPNVLSQ